jgi:hypothetical protein
MTYSAESILLPLQRLQQAHDEKAHRDILSFDLYKRLKHMVLHFYKYAGKLEAARAARDAAALRRTLLDAYIICMASANAMNVSLGKALAVTAETNDLDALAHALASNINGRDLFGEAISCFVLIGGHMAKAIESADHMEDANPRAAMAALVPQMTTAILGLLGHLEGGLEADVRHRLREVEDKSIFSGVAPELRQ